MSLIAEVTRSPIQQYTVVPVLSLLENSVHKPALCHQILNMLMTVSDDDAVFVEFGDDDV